MSRTSTRARVGLVAAIASLAALIPASSAPAQILEGPWAPFTACPVDDPEMLAVPPLDGYGVACVASTSPSGSFTIGRTTLSTRATRLQFGVAGATAEDPSLGKIVPATGGRTLVADPVKVPGGVLGLMCPASSDLAARLCRQVVDLGLNRVTAKVRLAGTPTGFNALGALVPDVPILTLPVKIQLQNPLLGKNCYIGSNANPIVLRPGTITQGTPSSAPDPNGFPVFFLTISGSTLADDSFRVPRATGCGPLGIANPAINQRQHLPSPAGNNELVLEDATAFTALSQQGGQVLSDAWHAAVISP
jgi:hypothetical protein